MTEINISTESDSLNTIKELAGALQYWMNHIDSEEQKIRRAQFELSKNIETARILTSKMNELLNVCDQGDDNEK